MKTKPIAARTKLSAFNGAKVNPAKNGYNTRIGRCVFVLTMHADNHLTRKIACNVCRHTFPIFYRPNTTSGNRNNKARCHNRRHFTLSHPFITFLRINALLPSLPPSPTLHNQLDFQLIPINNFLPLRQQLINVPLTADIPPAQPLPTLTYEPHNSM